MKKYIKYIVLFIILVLVGFVSLNFYNNTKLDNNFKTAETTKDTESNTKKEKEKTSQETPKENKENKTTSQEEPEKKDNNSSETNKTDESKTDNSSSNSNSTASTTENPSNSTTEENNSNTGSTSPIIQRKSSVTYRYDNETQSTNTTQNNANEEVTQESSNNSNITNESAISVIDVTSGTNAEPVIDVEEEDDEDDEEPQTITGTIIYSNTTTSEKNKNETNNTNNSSQKKNNANKKKNNATSNNQSKNNNNQSSNKKSTSTSTTIKDGTVVGATGYSALNSKKYLRVEPSNNSAAIVVLKGGVPFKILATKKNDTWWKVQYKGKVGYVENAYCMINLPDYIPSITYRITNASKSIYKSSGEKLSVTGKQLYKTGKVYNERLEKNQYIVPVVYSFAKKILAAQKTALREGYSLKIYDAYRPTSVSTEIKNSLQSLYNSNATVRNNINYAPNGSYWGQSWFLAQNLSAHNVASAIDVTLTKKGSTKNLKMPTKVHELSTAAIKYKNGVSGQTTVRNDLYISTMNENAKKLDSIMLKAGLTNLASEWWHFQDNEAYGRIKAYEPTGLNFQPTKIVSVK